MIDTAACGNNLHGKSMSGKFSWKKLAVCLSIALAATMLQGCRSGTIRGITGQVGSLNPPGTPYPNTPGTPSYNVYHFKLIGDRVCGNVRIDFGDGTHPQDVSAYDFSNPIQVDHYYGGWGGKKTVKAIGILNCAGSAQEIIEVAPSVYTVAYGQPRPTSCDDVSAALNKPPLRVGTIVHIMTTRDIKINFGCAFDGCIFDADGKNPSSAAPPFPFPGLREFSMVIRVGTQPPVQGGTDVTFTTTQAGPLEVCVNDPDLFNNTGAWGLHIEVDESGAP